MDNITTANACTLVPGDVHLSTTGADVGMWVVLAGILVAAGVVALLFALLLRRKRGAGGQRVAAAALLVVLLAVAGQIPAPRALAAQAGCDLIGWSMLSAIGVNQNITLSPDPTQVVAFTLQNVSGMPIEVQFRTDTTSDPDGIAPFVELVAGCAGCEVPSVYEDTMGALQPAAAFRLASGQRVEIRFTARTLPSITNDKQGKSATFSVVALSRQV